MVHGKMYDQFACFSLCMVIRRNSLQKSYIVLHEKMQKATLRYCDYKNEL